MVIDYQIDYQSRAITHLCHDLLTKGKTRAEILVNFDEDLADDNTDEITMSDYQKTMNQRSMKTKTSN